MTMKVIDLNYPYSPGFLLLWEFATAEAKAGTHDVIRPEHFFLALCCAGDIPIGAQRDDGSPILQEHIPRIEQELRAVRQAFEASHFDPQLAQHRIRVLLGKPGKRPPDNIWHRTTDARWWCDQAIRTAIAEGENSVTPIHLLKALIHPEANFPVLDRVITLALRQRLQGI